MPRGDDDQLFDDIQQNVEQAFAQFGQDLVDTIRDRLSEPAQVFIGPRGGRIIIGSDEGEPPCMRTGRLRDSISFEVVNEDGNLRLILGSSVEYAPYLDPGTDRLIFTGILEEFSREFEERIANAINGK